MPIGLALIVNTIGKRKSLMCSLTVMKYLRCCPHCGLGERSIDENESVLQVYPDFRNYINYSIERDEELDEKLLTLPFNSKRKFNFKCPTCQLSWKDSATNKRLFQLTSGDLFHFGCNETFLSLRLQINLSKFS